MKQIPAKSPRVRLDADAYRELHRRILERDGWRCQICGSMQNLQVHHLKLRSQSGGDEEQNLITLCTSCHERAHGRSG
jgi:5-methylcytosine-specific restriction endonuclease McrA